MTENLIEIRQLNVAFGAQTVVRDLSLDIRPGECLALVGESGSGKSVTAHSILQLLPQTGCSATGSVRYRGQELIGASPATLQQLRGNRIAMIFQEPMTSLNPLHSVEKQIGETLLLHRGLGARRPRRGSSNCWSWWASRSPGNGSRPTRINFPAASASG
ncbi:hypothetical protein PBOI14_45940 [Pseudomonas sp. Boi14]|nr:hypothetical protein PBOI14_45940 [Pseudomonas sp. Boi14]